MEDSATMEQPLIRRLFGYITSHSDITFAAAIIGILMVLLFPVPVMLLDFLLAISITISVIILMTCLFIKKPLDLSMFPTILLVTAILRLSLNIASTRLILANGHTGTGAAGGIIKAFAGFITGNNVVIGAIVFAILTIINFVVITKGSGRIAEVAARFSLDAMPGKQMAIDSDLSAGIIDENVAKARRKKLEDESTFFGSMDGANKFVRGDAIAGILITFINIIAGVIIGVVQRGISFDDALHTYTSLTIGDGLVSQIPALIVSLSTGLLVSKSGVVGSTDKIILGQLGRYPQSLALSSILMSLIAVMPSLPTFPFLTLSGIIGFIAYCLYQYGASTPGSDAEQQGEQDGESQAEGQAADADKEDFKISDVLQIDNIRLELSYNLLPLLNYTQGTKLTEQIKSLRKQMAQDLGFIIPAIRIQDNMMLSNNNYVIKIKDIECGGGEVYPDKLMVMDSSNNDIPFDGIKTTEPAFGLPATWIDNGLREDALFKNYTVVDPPTVITTHLTEIY